MIAFPIPEDAFKLNLLAWLATRSETYLAGFSANITSQAAVTSNGTPTTIPARCIIVEPGTASSRQIADGGMVTISIYGPTGDLTTTKNIAAALKAALPGLVGNGISSVTNINGPTAASDASGRPKRVLSCNYIALGSTVA